MNRRTIIILFDILSIVLCALIYNVHSSLTIGIISFLMSIGISLPIIIFVLNKKDILVNKAQSIFFKAIMFLFELLCDIPIVGLIVFFSPIIFYGITVGRVEEITKTSFFSYFIMVSIILRIAFEVIWYIIYTRPTKRKIQIN